MNGSASAWVSAARPRTLPLALASIFLGSFLAAYYGTFSWSVVVWASITTIFLQVLSNLANDYGDSVHGADSAHRQGPQRAVQAGLITARAMRTAMLVFGLLSLVSGLYLLYSSVGFVREVFFFFFGLGLLAIAAAITYTSGSRPYGYAGLGDISVFLFFGLVGVLGTFYLHAQWLSWSLLLPASACGLFSTAVLNVNNIRDIQSDALAGKRSIPVRIGRQKAVLYHALLLIGGLLAALAFVLLDFRSPWQLLFLLSAPLILINLRAVYKYTEAAALDPFLKQMALSTLLFVLLFGLGHLLAA
ncbi:1,4-dihydroxy-2-naphthoate polyprenyltransferase [Cesiribacter andamanensis]|uniref:1,4-dihydroxy-2-naphthoate octaprenyltransferase n=1 Tax=Cesiribacter andamanensis AMV16 TaxID=1279009 RepID=M7P2Q7_9BACT|nr:1,4-dihydroxy-2-naphthoate polyprenyltransferase [Cesiribacter andamanensis]EMR04834.1 1,4-dihydroxy-2-naphthoate octaprenyltransferase [Cesiribacter andamanensis AMV16]